MGRIPANQRLAERKLIQLVRSGEWEIDEHGRIWRTFIRTGLKRGGSHLVPVKKRRVEKRLPNGYLMVRATIEGKRICGLAHRLVWQNVRGDIPDGKIVNHKNGLKDENFPDNLELSTYSGNHKHAHEHGLIDQYGEKNPAAKLTNNQVAQIRLAYSQGGYTMEQLAKRFSISFQHVSKLIRGSRRGKQGGKVESRDLRHSVCDRDPKTGRYIGKQAAGRLLDGREWNEFPEASRHAVL